MAARRQGCRPRRATGRRREKPVFGQTSTAAGGKKKNQRSLKAPAPACGEAACPLGRPSAGRKKKGTGQGLVPGERHEGASCQGPQPTSQGINAASQGRARASSCRPAPQRPGPAPRRRRRPCPPLAMLNIKRHEGIINQHIARPAHRCRGGRRSRSRRGADPRSAAPFSRVVGAGQPPQRQARWATGPKEDETRKLRGTDGAEASPSRRREEEESSGA